MRSSARIKPKSQRLVLDIWTVMCEAQQSVNTRHYSFNPVENIETILQYYGKAILDDQYDV